MPSGEGNENGKKKNNNNNNRVISKKATLHVQHALLVHLFAFVLLDC